MTRRTAKYSVVVPVLNRKCSLPISVPIALSENVSFRKIRGEDLAVITEHDNEAASYLTGGRYTLTIDNHDYTKGQDNFSDEIFCAAFVLNVLSRGSALALNQVFVLRRLRSLSIIERTSIAGHHHALQTDFAIASDNTLENAMTLFSSTLAAIKTHPPLRLTMARLNSAAGRALMDEKVVDLCIALESVFQSQTEIAFQFALYNTLLSEPSADKRIETFSILKKLYTQRSNIVHGNKEVDDIWCQQNFLRLLAIAKTSVLRKIEHLTLKDHNEWKSGLEKLALGIK